MALILINAPSSSPKKTSSVSFPCESTSRKSAQEEKVSAEASNIEYIFFIVMVLGSPQITQIFTD